MIKGSEKVADLSKGIVQRNTNTWITIYYDYNESQVLAEEDYNKLEDKGHAYELTVLIRPNTAKEVSDTVNRMIRF